MPRAFGVNRAEPRWARRRGRRRVAGVRCRGAGGVWAGAVGAVGEVRRALRSERDGLRQEMRGLAPRGIRRMDGGAAVGVAHAKTKVEVGVFHVKHLYADKPHLRSARMHGPSALAGKLRVPSGDPRPELEVSGGGVQTGVQTEVRAACAGCGRALPQSPSGGGGQFLASRSRQRVVRSVRRFARDSEPHTARNATSAMARPAQRLRAWSVRTKGGGGAALGRPHKGRGVAASAHFCCECIWRLEVNGHPALSASPRSLFLLLKHTNRRYAKGRRTSWNR